MIFLHANVPITCPVGTDLFPSTSVLLFVSDGDDSDFATIQSNKEMQRLRRQVKEYEEENNLLKYKIELLLDMVIILVMFSHFHRLILSVY